MTLKDFHPAHKFMYEFGCFTAFWSNFELMMEVGIWIHTKRSAKENCKDVNLKKTAGEKKEILKKLLSKKHLMDAYSALEKVFAVADRNGWIHGHVLNPNGDFSRLTRLRVQLDGDNLKVDNTTIDVSVSPFLTFYEAFGEFEAKSGISREKCNEYIALLQAA